MGIFDGLFGTKQETIKSNFNWIPLTTLNQLAEIQQDRIAVSIIFKHSTRCSISNSVIRRFENKHQNQPENINFYYLDLLSFREISNEIANRFNVNHQSPQVLVIKNGRVEAFASHYDILDLPII